MTRRLASSVLSHLLVLEVTRRADLQPDSGPVRRLAEVCTHDDGDAGRQRIVAHRRDLISTTTLSET
jgi:hypothetical protein